MGHFPLTEQLKAALDQQSEAKTSCNNQPILTEIELVSYWLGLEILGVHLLSAAGVEPCSSLNYAPRIALANSHLQIFSSKLARRTL